MADTKRSLAGLDEILGELEDPYRDIHQHPELGDQETRTSQLVADHLRNLGLEVRNPLVFVRA